MKKYVLFDSILDINHTLPLVSSAKELFAVLGFDIPVLSGASKDKGLEFRGEDSFAFYLQNAKTLALAGVQKSDIVCAEDSSFLSLKCTLSKLQEDEKIKDMVIDELKKESLELSFDVEILTMADFIIKEFGLKKLKKETKNSFDKFLAALYLGSYQCQLSKYADSNSYEKLLETVGLKLVSYDLKNQVCGYEISDTDEKLSYKMAGALMLDMFDNAADFVVINDARSFVMFDELQKELESVVGREIGLAVFTLAEVLMMALGVSDKKRLGLDNHAVKSDIV